MDKNLSGPKYFRTPKKYSDEIKSSFIFIYSDRFRLSAQVLKVD